MNLNEPPSLLRNDVTGTNSWLKVKLIGTKSNRSAIGGRVVVKSGDIIQTQEVQSQSSFVSCDDFRLHFGLGAGKKGGSQSSLAQRKLGECTAGASQSGHYYKGGCRNYCEPRLRGRKHMWAQASSLVLRHSWRSRPSGTLMPTRLYCGAFESSCCRVTSLGERKRFPASSRLAFCWWSCRYFANAFCASLLFPKDLWTCESRYHETSFSGFSSMAFCKYGSACCGFCCDISTEASPSWASSKSGCDFRACSKSFFASSNCPPFRWASAIS